MYANLTDQELHRLRMALCSAQVKLAIMANALSAYDLVWEISEAEADVEIVQQTRAVIIAANAI